MPHVADFRTSPSFVLNNVDISGKYIGKNSYWRLYSIENILRIIIHSVLSVQINNNWWNIAADPTIQNKATHFRNRYLNRPWYSSQGTHDIYYIDLYDLAEIIRVHSHLFSYAVTDIDQWIVKIESIRLPRNVIAHMNFPSQTDCDRINILYNDLTELMKHLSRSSSVALLIP